MKSRVAALLLLCGGFAALSACMPGNRDGTAVGNPGNMDVSVSGTPQSITLDTARLTVDGVALIGCTGFSEFVDFRGELDALGVSAQPVELPFGSWCQAYIELPADESEQLFLSGITSTGTAFQVVINPDVIRIRQQFLVDGNRVLVGIPIGDFLNGEELDELAGPESDVDLGDSDVPDDWEDSVVEGSILYDDVDLDGVISDADDPTFAGDDEEPPPDATAGEGASCGCRTALPAGGWLLGLPLLWLTTRRRG